MKPVILLALMIIAAGKRLQSQNHETVERHPYLKYDRVRRQIDSQPYSIDAKVDGPVNYRHTPENDTHEETISIKSLFKANFTRKKRDALTLKNAGNDNSRRKSNTGYNVKSNKFFKNNSCNRHNNEYNGKINSVKVHYHGYNGQVTSNRVPNNAYSPSTKQNRFLNKTKRSQTNTVYDQIQSQLAAANMKKLIQLYNISYGSRYNNPFHSSTDNKNKESDESNETSEEESREIPPNNIRIRVNINNNTKKLNNTGSKHKVPDNGNIDGGTVFTSSNASNNGFNRTPERNRKYIIRVPGCIKGQKSFKFGNKQFCFPGSDKTRDEWV